MNPVGSWEQRDAKTVTKQNNRIQNPRVIKFLIDYVFQGCSFMYTNLWIEKFELILGG